MTASIALLAPLADALILLALAAAVASPRLSQLARPLIATFAFACAWCLTAVISLLRAPDWTLFTGGTVIVVSIVVMMVTVHLWTQEAGARESSPGRRGDDGGSGPRRRRPDAPQPGGGGADPSWWPEFERRLALYVAERDRREPAGSPPSRRCTPPTTSPAVRRCQDPILAVSSDGAAHLPPAAGVAAGN